MPSRFALLTLNYRDREVQAYGTNLSDKIYRTGLGLNR
jgi:hypothetical protein